MKKHKILPPPTLERLAHLYTLLGKLSMQGAGGVSSKDLSLLLGVPDHTIRKDISLLKGRLEKPSGFPTGVDTIVGLGSGAGKGYPILKLRSLIGDALRLTTIRKACLVGLGNLGVAILNRKIWLEGVYRLIAAFDSSENRLELLSTKVPLYHVRDLESVVRKQKVEIGVLTVPPDTAQDTTNRLVKAGIRGILNFTQVVLSIVSPSVFIRNLSLDGELHVLSSYLSMEEEQTDE